MKTKLTLFILFLVLIPSVLGFNTTNITGWFENVLIDVIEGLQSEENITIEETTEDIRKKADYPCPTDISFIKRLFSTCKVSNQICDDGEWLLLDKDCKLNEDIFYQMWLLRIILFTGFILFIKENRYFPIMVILLMVLFYVNGALY